MRKTIPFFIAAAVMAPLYLSTPAMADSPRHIQRLEEQVQEAKNRGDWGYAENLERQLNMERLAFQRSTGQGERQENPNYYQYNVRQNNRYYPNNNNRDYYQQSRRSNGYYDAWGNWRRY